MHVRKGLVFIVASRGISKENTRSSSQSRKPVQTAIRKVNADKSTPCSGRYKSKRTQDAWKGVGYIILSTDSCER